MKAFYNDNVRKGCAWLRELIKQGHITDGVVDDRPIQELRASDLEGFERVHFFAGIGGWDYALNLAGWTGPVWTGSCPCQPFSAAGKRQGVKDERHLWPEMFRLMRESEPVPTFGEQVATAIGHGWLDQISSDLEGAGYAVGSAVLGAHSVGATHIRNRLYWIASPDAGGVRSQGERTPAQEPWPWEQLSGLVQTELRVSIPAGSSGGVRDGFPARVVALRGYGNAIVPQVAAAFISAYMEEEGEEAEEVTV